MVDSQQDIQMLLRDEIKHLRHLLAQRSALVSTDPVAWEWEIDAQGNYCHVSPGVSEAVGFAPKDMLGKPPREFLVDPDKSSLQLALEASLRGGNMPGPHRVLHRHQKGGQLVMWFSVYASSAPPKGSGRCRGLALWGCGPEAQSQALRQCQCRYQAIVDHTPDAILRFDREGRMAYANPRVRCHFSVTEEQVVRRTISYLGASPADDRQCQRMVHMVFATGQAMETELRMVTLQGPRYFEWRFYPEPDGLGGTAYVVGVARNVTQQRRAEKDLNMLFAQMQDGFALWEVIHDAHGRAVDVRFLHINPALERMSGVPAAQLLGQSMADMHPPVEAHWWRALFQVAAGGQSVRVQGPARFMGGHLEVVFFQPQEGRVAALARDITQQVHSKEQLASSEQRYRTLFDNLADPVAIMDTQGRFLEVNEAACQHFALPREQLLGSSPRDFDEPDSNIMIGERLRTLQEKGKAVFETVSRNAQGQLNYGEIHACMIRYKGAPAILCAVRDLNERRRVESALRQSEEHYRLLAEHSEDVIWTVGMDMRFNYVSPSAQRLTGHTPAEVMAMHPSDTMDQESWQKVQALWAMRLEKARAGMPVPATTLQVRQWHKDGRLIWVESVARPLWDQEGRLVGLLGVSRNIETRKRVEVRLRSYQRELELANRMAQIFLSFDGQALFEELLNLILAHMGCSDGLVGYIDDLGNLSCPAMTAMDGLGSQLPDRLVTLERGQWRDLWGRCLLDQEIQLSNELETSPRGDHRLANAMAAPILAEGRLLGEVMVANRPQGFDQTLREELRGITRHMAPLLRSWMDRQQYERERRNLEDQLRQAQKMEAIGTLAGGIAHDFNNILGSLVGFNDLARESLERGDREEAKDYLREVSLACARARDLVKQILAFSRQAQQERLPINLGIVVKEACKLLRATLPSTIRIEQDLGAEEDPLVTADPVQIQQILMNLATNAAHAMHPQGGVLGVSLTRQTLPTDRQMGGITLPAGDYVKLTVTDTGHGMSPEVMRRIFDPFFTTKQKGVGTGLGLAMVHGIVRGHGGSIKVRSHQGRGSTFEVFLPCLDEDQPPPPKREVAKVPMGSGRILLVDDDRALLSVQTQLLTQLGYQVDPAQNAKLALELFARDPLSYDLVLSDVTMPDTTGVALMQQLLALRPDLPVILCTGYTDLVSHADALGLGARELLYKPLDRMQLATAVQNALVGQKDTQGS